MRSYFEADLDKEMLLAKYLDKIYEHLEIDLIRISDLNLQYQGVDLKFHFNGTEYHIDEKAQLNYINSNLPTFAFELSYFKGKSLKLGWLLDGRKSTTHYFLVTDIHAEENRDGSLVFSTVQIISVHRNKLLFELDKLGLTAKKIRAYDKEFRQKNLKGQKAIDELDEKREGKMHLSAQLAEKPLNLVLRLEFLIRLGVAKKIYPDSNSN